MAAGSQQPGHNVSPGTVDTCSSISPGRRVWTSRQRKYHLQLQKQATSSSRQPQTNPVALRLGEISKKYLRSGVEECLANISKLIHALVDKCDGRIPRDKMEVLVGGKVLFAAFRSLLWKQILITGNVDVVDNLFLGTIGKKSQRTFPNSRSC